MTAKVGPMRSEYNGDQRRPQRRALKDPTVSMNSIHYHDVAVYAYSGEGAVRGTLNNEAAWIRNKINMRRCNRFVPAEKNDICQCGYSKQEHQTVSSSSAEQDVVNPTSKLKWECEKHTDTVSTNAFGEIEFVGLGGNIGKFVRVDKLTKMSTVLELMMKVWELEKPNLLISVTGGAKNFNMKPRLRDVFRRGLMRAAQTTGAWIITGGTHAGVMKHVGEAVKDYGMTYTNQKPVITIGIVPWGVIQNRNSLENKQGSWPAEYHIDEPLIEKESFLDPNHSHFIMVDDGTQHKFATEIRFRAKLERKISKMQTDTGDGAVKVPIVILVLEGGPGTLETVENALKKNTPAVIVKGSGRAADILAHAFKYAKAVEVDVTDKHGQVIRITEKHINSTLEFDIHQKMKDINFCEEKEISIHIQRIKDCLAKSDLIHIFEWDTGTGARDIDVSILKALLRANKNQVMDQLKLALAWNRIDVVKSEIFADEKSWLESGLIREMAFLDREHTDTLSLDDIMLSAMQLNRVDFVKLFLDNGVSLKEFLTIKRLLHLYNNGSAIHTVSSRSVLINLLNKMRRENNDECNKKITLKEVGQLMQDLLGEYYLPHYISDHRYADIDLEKGRLKTELANVALVPVGVGIPLVSIKKSRKENPDFDNPAQELFIWSLLNNRQDMAKLFWLQGKDAIAAALVAHALLYAMSDRTDDTELLAQITENTNSLQSSIRPLYQHLYSLCRHTYGPLVVNSEFFCLIHLKGFLTLLPGLSRVLCRLFVLYPHILCEGAFSVTNACLSNHFTNITSAHEFMNLAIGVLKECYSTDEKKAQCLLIKKLSEWGNTTCVLIAVKANNRQFISQTACQDLFNSIWMGGMTQENSILRLLACIAIPPLIPLLVMFKENEDGEPSHDDHMTHVSEQHQTDTSWKRRPSSLQAQGSRNDSEGGKMDEKKVDSKSLNIVEKFASFYQAPVIIFCHNVISYAVFLGLYSYILISTFEPNVSVEEGILIAWVVTFLAEEIRQVATTESMTLKTKLLSYITDGWNILDVLAILLFTIGIILRAIPNRQETFEAARVFLGVSLVTFFLRLLHIFSVNKNLGPKLVMIMHMVRDMIYFVVILMVFVLAYAIASHAILFPKTELNLITLKSIFRRPYWNIYGELMLDEIEGKDCTTVPELYKNETMTRCPTDSGKYFVPVLMGVYMLMCYILLLNLLIAMFSGNPDMDYFDIPLMTVEFVQTFVQSIATSIAINLDNTSPKVLTCHVKVFPDERELRLWEDVIADTFHHKRELADLESTDCRVKTTALRLDQLVNKLDELQEQQQAVTVTAEDAESEQKTLTGIESSSVKLEKRIENIEITLKWIVESLSEHHLGARRAIPVVTDVRVEEKKQEEKKAAEARALVHHMMEGQVKVHTRSRNSPYPETNLHRFKVPNDKVPWDVEFPEYDPPTYTSPVVLAMPDWADKVDLYHVDVGKRKLQFNAIDSATNTKRFSYVGNYRVQNGIPLNPIGRTGLQSRGILGRWGPNHAVDPVITRWKYDKNDQQVLKDGKPEFEFVAVRRLDTKLWALPGSILAPGHPPTENLKIKFSDEALGVLGEDRQQKKKIKKQMEKILKKGKLIHKGYADDPRNTDNAWLESTVYLYQDKNNVLRHFSLQATAPGLPATWLPASSEIPLHGAHSYFLKLVAEHLGASF